MSDYLTHLTNRIMQGGDVHPRPRSRFESFQPVEDIQEEQVETNATLSPISPLMSRQFGVEDTSVQNTAVSPQPPREEQKITPTIHQVVNRVHNSSPVTVNESSITEQNYFVKSAQIQTDSIDPPTIDQSVVEKETIVERTTPSQTIVAHNDYPTEPTVKRPLAPTVPIPNEARLKTEKTPPVIEKETSLETETIVEKHEVNTIRPNRPIQHIMMPPASSVTSPRGDGVISQTEPVINVTIGRIEVKANTPPTPAPAAKPSKKAPIMTLDEYLKRGRGGGL